jgi:hypothetical protein
MLVAHIVEEAFREECSVACTAASSKRHTPPILQNSAQQLHSRRSDRLLS